MINQLLINHENPQPYRQHIFIKVLT